MSMIGNLVEKLSLLQRRGRHYAPHISPDQLSRAFEELGLSESVAHLKGSACIHSQSLSNKLQFVIPHVAKRLGIRPEEFSRQVGMECDPSWTPACFSVPKETQIRVSHGFLYVAYQFASIAAAASELDEDSGQVVELSKRFKELMGAYATAKPIPKVISPLLNLTSSQRLLAGYLTYWLEMFVVCHELGHIIINRIGSSCQALKAARALMEVQMRSMSLPGKSADFVEPWSEELACDMRGVELASQASRERQRLWPDSSLSNVELEGPTSGAVLFLLVLASLEEFWVENKHSRQHELLMGHPPAILRWTLVRHFPGFESAPWELADFLLVVHGLLNA